MLKRFLEAFRGLVCCGTSQTSKELNTHINSVTLDKYEPNEVCAVHDKAESQAGCEPALAGCLSPQNCVSDTLVLGNFGNLVDSFFCALDLQLTCVHLAGPVLGVGTFGAVHQARWQNQIVAVKVLTPSKNQSKRLKLEVMISLMVEHPNVVHCFCTSEAEQQNSAANNESIAGRPGAAHQSAHDSALSFKLRCSIDEAKPASFRQGSSCSALATITVAHAIGDSCAIGTTYIVMELCSEGSLGDACAAKRFFTMNGLVPCLRAVLLRARDIARGMAYLHRCNICHGDLKCDNVLLQTDLSDPYHCIAKVADFGLSVALEPPTHRISVGSSFGTISHQAPELFSQGMLYLASDVYAFGIIMWELVNITSPYAGLHACELMKNVCDGLRPMWPSHIPEPYCQLAEDCWCADPATRPKFSDLVQRIDDLLTMAEELQEACEKPLHELHEWMRITF